MKRNTNFRKVFLGVLALGALVSCTDLEVEQAQSIDAAAFEGITDPSSFINGLYGAVNGYVGDQTNYFALSEVTSDEFLIPTRGGDWGDNGLWRQLHQHQWTSEHSFIANVWNQWNSLHFGADQVLSPLTTAATPGDVANAQFLRALGVWVILDHYGQVPRRDPEAPLTEDPIVLRGQEAVDQIVTDLEAAIAGLPTEGPGATNDRPSKAVARYLLAKVLLNKHIYVGGSPDSGDMNRVVTLVDAITADGYALADDYFDIFRETEDTETMWWLSFGVGNRIWNGLHYVSSPEIAGGGWNGFATLAEFYDLFEGDENNNEVGNGQEERRGFVPTEGIAIGDFPGGSDSNGDGFADGTNQGFGFLIGQQYDYDGTPLNDRAGAPLTFKRDFRDGNGDLSLINNDETTGIRVLKYNPRFGGFTNHEIFFRYADAHLMKAEAIMRSGGDPTPLVNELRIKRGANPLGSVSEQDLLDERGRELYEETWRRNDMIRFGQFTRDWAFKDPAAVGNTDKNLYPIPASQIILNPNLTQNPGY